MRVNILLVEDDEIDIKAIKKSFEKNHINNPLFVARNGIEALQMLRDSIARPRFVHFRHKHA